MQLDKFTPELITDARKKLQRVMYRKGVPEK